jgi:hypothetical protein
MSVLRPFLAPDVTTDGQPCLSVGMKIQAVPAAF